MRLTWDRVLAWRARRQLLDRQQQVSAVDVVRRLCGVQAQVGSCAEQAVRTRLRAPGQSVLSGPLSGRELVKTWAMRGTLHVLTATDAGAYLALLAAARTWEKGSWQRNFLDARQMAMLADATAELLDGAVLSREELTAAVIARVREPGLAEQLRSGWGAVLKPLAWQGLLCHGPAAGNRVTFASPRTYLPGWTGLPDPDEAASYAIPAYLGAYGPAPAASFDDWILRGTTRRSTLLGWFSQLEAAGTITEVDVDGETLFARAGDAEEIAMTPVPGPVRLLPGFDQYVLGPGTRDTRIIDSARRSFVSKTAGWISPVVIACGRVAGTWEAGKDSAEIALFRESPVVASADIQAELDHLGIGVPLRITVV
jgi:hypothetical protein